MAIKGLSHYLIKEMRKQACGTAYELVSIPVSLSLLVVDMRAAASGFQYSLVPARFDLQYSGLVIDYSARTTSSSIRVQLISVGQH